MDRRCLFILISTILYLNNIQCDGNVKHHTIDFLKPADEVNLKHEVTTSSKTNGEDVITTTTPKTNSDEPNGVKKFIEDVKNKFNHIHPVRDVKNILFGSTENKTPTVATSTVSTSTTAESHIHKIVDSMPSESEDMIRVVTLKPDEHYGKGKAKPKYLTKELEKTNTTEYTGGSTTTSKTPVAGKTTIEDFSTPTSTPKSAQNTPIRK